MFESDGFKKQFIKKLSPVKFTENRFNSKLRTRINNPLSINDNSLLTNVGMTPTIGVAPNLKLTPVVNNHKLNIN